MATIKAKDIHIFSTLHLIGHYVQAWLIEMVHLIETVHLRKLVAFRDGTVHLIEIFIENSEWYT